MFLSCSVQKRTIQNDMSYDEIMTLMANIFLHNASPELLDLKIQHISLKDSIFSYKYNDGKRNEVALHNNIAKAYFIGVGGVFVYCEEDLPNSYYEKDGFLFLWTNPSKDNSLPDVINNQLIESNVVFSKEDYFIRLGTTDEELFSIYYTKTDPYHYVIRYESCPPTNPPVF